MLHPIVVNYCITHIYLWKENFDLILGFYSWAEPAMEETNLGSHITQQPMIEY